MKSYGILLIAYFLDGNPGVLCELVWDEELGFRLKDTETGGYISDKPHRLRLVREKGE